MNRPGPIALIGGLEHRRGCETIDGRLLADLDVAAPRAVVVPVASTRRQLPLTAALARTYWARLGARVSMAIPDGNGCRSALDAVAAADVIVLPGGHPNRFVASLAASPVWDAIIDRWREGAAIAGSSAGAMCLFAWRLRLYPPDPLNLIPGLGPFHRFVVAPHFDRFRAQRWALRLTDRFDPLGLIGLDESTAMVGRDGRFTVAGPGEVTVIEDGRLTVHPSGSTFELDLDDRHVPLPETALHSVASHTASTHQHVSEAVGGDQRLPGPVDVAVLAEHGRLPVPVRSASR